MNHPYAPPTVPASARPATIMWFRLYAAVMALANAAGAVVLFTNLAHEAFSVFVAITCLALLAFHVLAVVMPLRPWAWTVGLVVIALGIPGITIVFALPLLIAWMKPTLKAAFGRPPF
jgi:hypothetical protein